MRSLKYFITSILVMLTISMSAQSTDCVETIGDFYVNDVHFQDDSLYIVTVIQYLYSYDGMNLDTLYKGYQLGGFGFTAIAPFDDDLALSRSYGSTAEAHLYDRTGDSTWTIITYMDYDVNPEGTDYGHAWAYDVGSLDGHILLGTSAGLIVSDLDTVFQYKSLSGVSNFDSVYQIRNDTSGNAWLGTPHGIFVMNDINRDSIRLLQNTITDNISALLPLSEDLAYYATSDGRFMTYMDGDVTEIAMTIESAPAINDMIQFDSLICFIVGSELYAYDGDSIEYILKLDHTCTSLSANDSILAIGTTDAAVLLHCTDLVSSTNNFKGPSNIYLVSYPNPCHNELNIVVRDKTLSYPISVRILGVRGHQHISRTFSDIKNFKLDVGHLPPGIYTAVVESREFSGSISFVKQ